LFITCFFICNLCNGTAGSSGYTVSNGKITINKYIEKKNEMMQ